MRSSFGAHRDARCGWSGGSARRAASGPRKRRQVARGVGCGDAAIARASGPGSDGTISRTLAPSLAGTVARVHISNLYGTEALAVAATVGGRGARFGGLPSIAIPPGATVVSDAVKLSVAPGEALEVRITLPMGGLLNDIERTADRAGALLRDPGRPSRLAPRYDSGNHFTPNQAGVERMAQVAAEALFSR